LTFVFRPWLVLWGGLAGAVAWGAGTALMLRDPGASILSASPAASLEEVVAALADPHTIDLTVRVQEIGVFLIVAGVIAVAVWRSQRLVLRQATIERERANLARYFAPAMVDRLATSDTPLAESRETEIAVLFVDVVGFTRWTESHPPP